MSKENGGKKFDGRKFDEDVAQFFRHPVKTINEWVDRKIIGVEITEQADENNASRTKIDPNKLIDSWHEFRDLNYNPLAKAYLGQARRLARDRHLGEKLELTHDEGKYFSLVLAREMAGIQASERHEYLEERENLFNELSLIQRLVLPATKMGIVLSRGVNRMVDRAVVRLDNHVERVRNETEKKLGHDTGTEICSAAHFIATAGAEQADKNHSKEKIIRIESDTGYIETKSSVKIIKTFFPNIEPNEDVVRVWAERRKTGIVNVRNKDDGTRLTSRK